MMPSHPLEFAQRVGREDFGPEVRTWLVAGFRPYNRGQGTLRLEVCLHLPTSQLKYRLEKRNTWLQKAATLTFPDASAWDRARLLLSALARFRAAGDYRLWTAAGAPPVGVEPQREALFFACFFDDSGGLEHQQLYRILCKLPASTVTFSAASDSERLSE